MLLLEIVKIGKIVKIQLKPLHFDKIYKINEIVKIKILLFHLNWTKSLKLNEFVKNQNQTKSSKFGVIIKIRINPKIRRNCQNLTKYQK